MLQLIAFIIFVLSAGALGVMLYKKIPALVGLSQAGRHGFKKPQFVVDLEKKLREHHFHIFQKQIWLQKLLSRARVVLLKTERIIGDRLMIVRKKAHELDKEKLEKPKTHTRRKKTTALE